MPNYQVYFFTMPRAWNVRFFLYPSFCGDESDTCIVTDKCIYYVVIGVMNVTKKCRYYGVL